MRAVLVVAMVVAACHVYDPVDEIPHEEYPDTTSAVQSILDSVDGIRVYAIGEYHPTRDTAANQTPLARFNSEIIGLLEPNAKHLVVEAWLDGACNASPTDRPADSVAEQVHRATGRASAQQGDVARLVARTDALNIQAHGLPMTCIEHAAMLDGHGRVDFWRLLVLVTEKLFDTTKALVDGDDDRAVIVYGGALHNDLYPRWPLEDISYAHTLRKELGGHGILEIDLVVPEVVVHMRGIRHEPWFPLLGRSGPGRVIVWERGPDSYVVILPAQSEAVAKVARPIERT